MTANIVQGDSDNPIVIALHAFGQTIAPKLPWWRRNDFWYFAVQSHIIQECEARGWSCYMPQAPGRNWRLPYDATNFWRVLAAMCRALPQPHSRLVIAGLSDGATLVNHLCGLVGHANSPLYVSYSGMDVAIEPAEACRALLVRNMGEPARIRDQVERFADRFRPGQADLLEIDSDRHAWESFATPMIFDWVEDQP